MKTYFNVAKIFVLVFAFTMVSCDLLKKDDTLSAEDAKVEIRAAGDEIMANVAQMMTTPAMSSLMFFSGLMDIDLDIKASGMILGDFGLKPILAAKDETYSGVFHFNFSTGDFDLVNASVAYLEFHFPGDQQAANSGQRNAVMRISNLTFFEYYDEYWEEYETIPSRANVTLTVNNATAMTFNYQGSFNSQGMPTAVTADMNMSPYTMNMAFSGSGTSYTSTMSLKMNNSTLMSYNLAIRYTADLLDVERISGDIRVTPLEAKGNVKALAIEDCDYNDVACMNNNLEAELRHTALDKTIGDLEFRMVSGEATMVVVYEDGSYESLEEIFGAYLDFK
jgi:hypothetical protein